MSVEAMLDTNILVYVVSRFEADREKRKRAQELMRRPFGLSGQILHEFLGNVTRKIKVPLTPVVALEWVEQLGEQPCIPVDAALVKNAIVISERYRIHYYDGAIIAAAETLGASRLYTEDLNHGQFYGEVQVINPFV